MSESFVDLSYRGLALGKRIKLTQVRPATGFLELPTPMPVGTAIGIATDDGVLLEAQVAEIHEQVGGTDRVPGMLVKPKLDTDVARNWWSGHATLPQEKHVKEAPPPDAQGKVTVMSPRMSGQSAIPELMDDGRNTAVMDALVEAEVDTMVADTAIEGDTDPRVPRMTDRTMAAVSAPRDSQPIIDDGKHTTMMDAVDLKALGLDPASSSGSMAAMKDDGDENGNGNGGTDSGPVGKSKKKRKKR
jgi:hypothetical protein